jgi:MEDS: MEthanogen/methylotroph, DcmR Sensory domain
MSDPPTAPSGFSSAHAMQVFDSDESLSDAVADFCSEGVRRNESTLAVVGEQRWYLIAQRLSAKNVAVDDAVWRGLLTVRSAERMLKGIMRAGRPNLPLITTSMGPLISRLEAFGRPLRIYGEMVDVLASRGEHGAACELEQLWNVVDAEKKYTIFCSYTAANFADPGTADELRRICAAHSEVRSDPRDVRGSSLVRSYIGR